ncbi:hypothetical protein [Echinicola sp. 20G]|uniref:hypothetical protein n=1 Tax=Echinicola sp. 20G TaxID=2781961 RepID=UPI001910B5BF|nr:hypothetical protein [Echinicola sp. 20G]
MKKLLILFAVGSMMTLTSCGNDKSKVEEAGDKVEETMEDAGDAVEDAADDVEDEVEDATNN